MLDQILTRLHLKRKPLTLVGPFCAKCGEQIEDLNRLIEFKDEPYHFDCLLEVPTVERRIGERRAG